MFWVSTDPLQVVVEALTRNVGPDHIREIFGQYGAIQEVRMPMHPTCTLPALPGSSFVCPR